MIQQLFLFIIIWSSCWHPTEALIDGLLSEGATNDGELLLVSGNNGDVLTVSATIGAAFMTWALTLLGIYLLILALEDDDDESHGTRYGIGGNDEIYQISLKSAYDPTTCIQRLICELASNKQYADYQIVQSIINKQYQTIADKSEFSTAATLGISLKNPKLCSLRYACTLNSSEIQNELLQYKY